jgi:hypothetical protein
MEEQELNLLLNKSTKLVVRGVAGLSAVLEIQRTVNNPRFGHGWMIESRSFLEDHHITTIQDYMTAISPQEGASRGANTPLFAGSSESQNK